MKDLESKLSLESADKLQETDPIFDPDQPFDSNALAQLKAISVDTRALLVEILNELRAIRAHHCSLPWPEQLVELAEANKAGGSK